MRVCFVREVQSGFAVNKSIQFLMPQDYRLTISSSKPAHQLNKAAESAEGVDFEVSDMPLVVATEKVRILMRSIGKLQRENRNLRSEMDEHRRTRSFKKMQDDIGQQDVIIKALVARIGVQQSKQIIADALDKGPPRVRSKSRQELFFELEEARRVARRAAQNCSSQRQAGALNNGDRCLSNRASTAEESAELVKVIREELERTQRAEANTKAELELAKKALEAARHMGDQHSELVEARKRIDDLSNAMQDSSSREKQLTDTVKDLRAQLEELNRSSPDNTGWVTPSMAEVLKEKEELRRRMKAAEEETKNLRKELDVARRGREELMDISKRFRAERTEVEESALKLREDVARSEEENRSLRQKCEDVVEKHRMLNEEMHQLRGLLAAEQEHTAALSRKVGIYIGEANRGAIMERSIERMSMAVNVGELPSIADCCSPAAHQLGKDISPFDENKSPTVKEGSPEGVSGVSLKTLHLGKQWALQTEQNWYGAEAKREDAWVLLGICPTPLEAACLYRKGSSEAKRDEYRHDVLIVNESRNIIGGEPGGRWRQLSMLEGGVS
ncbi:hypothetical protein FOL47_010469, partial [Perkinsus chesapeaki]